MSPLNLNVCMIKDHFFPLNSPLYFYSNPVFFGSGHLVAGVLQEHRSSLKIPIPAFMWEQYYNQLLTAFCCSGLKIHKRIYKRSEAFSDDWMEIKGFTGTLRRLLVEYLLFPEPNYHVDWWAPLFSDLLTHINNSCQGPDG